MKKQAETGFLSFLLVFSLVMLVGCTAAKPTQTKLVTEVVDGDTLVVEGGLRVRLLGINAPEKGEAGYQEAKTLLVLLVLKKEVVLESDSEDKDQFHRLLRHVWIGDELISVILAAQGVARAKFFTNNEKHRLEIQEAEHQAIQERKGLWKDIP